MSRPSLEDIRREFAIANAARAYWSTRCNCDEHEPEMVRTRDALAAAIEAADVETTFEAVAEARNAEERARETEYWEQRAREEHEGEEAQ